MQWCFHFEQIFDREIILLWESLKSSGIQNSMLLLGLLPNTVLNACLLRQEWKNCLFSLFEVKLLAVDLFEWMPLGNDIRISHTHFSFFRILKFNLFTERNESTALCHHSIVPVYLVRNVVKRQNWYHARIFCRCVFNLFKCWKVNRNSILA